VRVLVVNAGSSTLKLTLLDESDRTIACEQIETADARIDARQLAGAVRGPLARADAIGHRIVHGGERYRDPVPIDDGVERALRELAELAPLHQARSLAALDAVSALLPDVRAVACFDTAFHATLSPAARTYALPAGWRERLGLRRYGFHGLSHAWIARRAPELLERSPQELRIVSCHLGAGASLCAIAGGESLDTTMGFTPLEGLVMATRSGTVDPGMLTWLLERGESTPGELSQALERRSGLLGLCGEADMREVLRRDASGDEQARLALAVYLRSLRAGIAAMAAALGGIDVLAFTGGVGEGSARIRALAAHGLGFLGVALDAESNEALDGEGPVSSAGARVATLVIRAREDREIARQVRGALGG
jgi:acetate kinase